MSDKPTGLVNIRGREYETVALRVKKFRDAHPDFTLQTEIISVNDEVVIMRAAILDAAGRLIATGHAEERRAASQINRTSALEVCETSAIGRALATFGLGGTEFATANEVQTAIHQQENPRSEPEMKDLIDRVITSSLEALEKGDAYAMLEVWEELNTEEQTTVWKEFNSKQKAGIRELLQQARGERVATE